LEKNFIIRSFFGLALEDASSFPQEIAPCSGIFEALVLVNKEY
jgi:hypothetical protein